MSKKVRYAVGAIGTVPALGLLAAPAAAGASAPAHTAKKMVRTASAGLRQGALSPTSSSCIASNKHTDNTTTKHLTFWSKPVGSRTCIGTIIFSWTGADGTAASGHVHTINGNFCVHAVSGTKIQFACRQTFVHTSLKVCGGETHAGFTSTICDKYPF